MVDLYIPRLIFSLVNCSLLPVGSDHQNTSKNSFSFAKVAETKVYYKILGVD